MSQSPRELLIETPFGMARLRLTADDALSELKLLRLQHDMPGGAQPRPEGAGAEVARQLSEYFAGERREFELPLAPPGSAFHLQVWRELQRIPYGTTTTYGELATRLGQRAAVRAVGRANALNPIWIIIPCHRVIGADGTLTGYAGGLEVKRRLLELEGALPPRLFE